MSKEVISTEPDYATKPKDIIGYCFGYACQQGHVNYTFETLNISDVHLRKVCKDCGEVAKPCTVKRTSEAKWIKDYSIWQGSKKEEDLPYIWKRDYTVFGKYTVYWTKLEFIRFVGGIDTHD